MKSYDIVESVTDEATKQFLGMREIPTRKEFLKNICEDIDALIERTEAESFSVDIDESAMDVILCVTCPEVIAEERDHPLHQVLVNTKSFTLRKSQNIEDGIECQFRVQGIWGAKL